MKKSITRDEWGTLILLLAIALGAYLRFNPTLLAGFAVNDGGMFAVMVDDLRANHYFIPAFTTYNFSNIPFAYPPLGFYFGALAADIFGMSSLNIVRWIPALFASLSIPAFYFLSLRLFKDKYHASLATLFFALVPRAYFWMVMGGGLTRAPGQFFMLLALGTIIRLYDENRIRDVFLAGLFAGLAVLSHPEAAVHTALSAVLLWLVLSRKRKTFIQSAFVAVVVLVVTAPWWVTVISNHGFAPLLSAMQTGENSLAILHLVFLTFTQEPFMTVIAMLGVIGIFHSLIRKDYLLPLWVVLPFLFAGRSATNLVILPLTMLAAVGLADVLLSALQVSGRIETKGSGQVTSIEQVVLFYFSLYLIFSSYQFGFQLSGSALRQSAYNAMNWVKQNTPEDSHFVVLSGSASVACDSVAEWFPAVSGRQSLFTVQGTEWTKSDDFKPFIREAVELQMCSRGTPDCVDGLVGASEYDYVYLSKGIQVDNCEPLPLAVGFSYFVESVHSDLRYEIVYENDDVLVFREH
jgi:4-amino-4-deoxy-L-arabinose transferase-like glycosyltransferase